MGRIDLSFVITPSSRLSTWKKRSGDLPYILYSDEGKRPRGTPSNRAYALDRHEREAERNDQILHQKEKR
jgi:hypothetical protein